MNLARAVLALALPAAAHAAQVTLPEQCAAAISQSLPAWTFIDVPPDAAKWAKDRGLNPTVTRGDFNADGRADYAALVTAGGVPHLAVCVSKRQGTQLLLEKKPYCSDVIFRSKAGKRYYNFETRRRERHPRDGVSVSCFEKAGATYVYEKGVLRRIVDSD